MANFETHTCNGCGESFEAHADSKAAQEGYCSPACQTRDS